jgi:hypothetical protein
MTGKREEDTARIKSHKKSVAFPLDPEKSDEHLGTTIGIKTV